MIGDGLFQDSLFDTTKWYNNAAAHGIAQGAISAMRGDDFVHGFASGLAGTLAGNATGAINGEEFGHIIARTMVASAFGALGVKAAGGDAQAGAISAAIVHLYNDENHRAQKEERTWGSYLPGTEAGDNAAQYWADIAVKSDHPLAPLANVPGVFAALWTDQTATNTAFTLGTAGLGSLPNLGSKLGSKLFLSETFGITSTRFAHSVTGATGSLNVTGSLFKIGWSGVSKNGGGMMLRIGLGGTGNAARFPFMCQGLLCLFC